MNTIKKNNEEREWKENTSFVIYLFSDYNRKDNVFTEYVLLPFIFSLCFSDYLILQNIFYCKINNNKARYGNK